MPFQKGQSGNPKGRKKGEANRLTQTFRDAIMTVYSDIGGDKAFGDWARDNPGDFYKIAARLVPVQLQQGTAVPVINFIMGAAELPAIAAPLEHGAAPKLTFSAAEQHSG